MGLLSVVTVVRNDPTGLERTLGSLARQSRLPDEIVIVDGSDDEDVVRSHVAAYEALPVTLLHLPPAGVYPAMNDGLEVSSGEYVYFLNAGDSLVGPDAIAEIELVLADRRPLWAFGRVRFVRPDGSVHREPSWSYREEWRHHLARGRFPAHQGVFARRDALMAQGGFDTTYRVAADYLMMLRLASAQVPLELDQVVAEFTTGGLSTHEWRVALREFHRARREALPLSGTSSLVEYAYTARAWLVTSVYRGMVRIGMWRTSPS